MKCLKVCRNSIGKHGSNPNARQDVGVARWPNADRSDGPTKKNAVHAVDGGNRRHRHAGMAVAP
jgi:hypothetical protein